jgi:hypothetical protein
MSPRGFRPSKSLAADLGSALASVVSSAVSSPRSPLICMEPECGAPSVTFWLLSLLPVGDVPLVFGRCQDHPFAGSSAWREVSRDEAVVSHVHSS